MYEPKVKVIDGMEFKVIPFSAIEALRLKADLIKLIGPSLGMALGSVGSAASIMDVKIDGEGLSRAFKLLFEQMDTDAFISLVKRVLSSTSVQVKMGEKAIFANFQDKNSFDTNFDMIFQEKLFTVYPAMLFVLEVNFPDFFAKAGAFGTRLKTSISEKKNGSEKSSSEKLVTSES